jgi:hypothetical protein
MNTARANDKQITSNTSCFKKAPELSSRREERPTKSDEKTSKSDNHQPNNGVNNGNEPSGSNRTLTSNKSDTVTPTAPEEEEGEVREIQRRTRTRREQARLKDFLRY